MSVLPDVRPPELRLEIAYSRTFLLSSWVRKFLPVAYCHDLDGDESQHTVMHLHLRDLSPNTQYVTKIRWTSATSRGEWSEKVYFRTAAVKRNNSPVATLSTSAALALWWVGVPLSLPLSHMMVIVIDFVTLPLSHCQCHVVLSLIHI